MLFKVLIKKTSVEYSTIIVNADSPEDSIAYCEIDEEWHLDQIFDVPEFWQPSVYEFLAAVPIFDFKEIPYGHLRDEMPWNADDNKTIEDYLTPEETNEH